jgi:hypothetical protein
VDNNGNNPNPTLVKDYPLDKGMRNLGGGIIVEIIGLCITCLFANSTK